MALKDSVQSLIEEFEVSPEILERCVDKFCEQATFNLSQDTDRGLPMIPTFITGVPTGEETGLYLAADLGGTNFRICSVDLKGNSTFEIEQQKWAIPPAVMRSTSKEFFALLVDHLEEFLSKHHEEHFATENIDQPKELKLGLTFSFPVEQTSINSGNLLRWTKGYDIKDLVGKDVCKYLQQEIDSRNLRVHVAALINDTVGCLMARAYANGGSAQTVMGCIFGTGTNAAYSEQLKNIPKFDLSKYPEYDPSMIMMLNTEWGSFDNDLEVLPNLRFDKAIDLLTPNPGYHMFEKRVSGMFLGEVLRHVLTELRDKNEIFQGSKNDSSNENLSTPWSVDSSVPSNIELDNTKDLSECEKIILEVFGFSTTLEEREAIKALAHAIGRRAAYLAAATMAGLLKQSKVLSKFEKIDIGVDGSVFEFYPGFEKHIREAWQKTFIGNDEKRISLGIAKDGSGVGAALCALVAK